MKTIREFSKVTTYYDMIALAYSILLKKTQYITRKKSDFYADLFSVYYQHKDNGVIITFNFVKNAVIERFNKYSKICDSFYNDVYEIFLFIEDYFANESFERIGQKRIKISKALNQNVESTKIIVLRKVKHRFIKNVEDYDERTFRTEITELEKLKSKHLDFLKARSFDDFDINIIEYYDNNLFTDNIEFKKNLSVEFVPVISQDINLICERFESDVSFEFIGYRDLEEEYSKRYLRLLKSALDNDSDLIIFPELLFTKSVREKYASFLSEYNSKKKKFIILGTQSIFGVNEAFVVDEKGRSILSQKKKKSYIEKTPNGDKWEKLIPDNVCNILQIEKFGRILVIVCADVYFDFYNSLLAYINIDFLVVVAFTPSLDIVTHCIKFSRENHLISLVSNSCSAFYKSDLQLKNNIEEKKEIGTIILPSKKDSDRHHFSTNYKMNDSCFNCDKSCENRIIKILNKLCTKTIDTNKIITIDTEEIKW